MNWIDSTIAAFGRSLGLEMLELDEDGCLAFELDDGGLLGIQRLGDDEQSPVRVSLARPAGIAPGAALRRAFALADFRRTPLWQAQVSLDGGQIAIGLRLAANAFVPSALEDAVPELFRLHEATATGGARA